MAFCEECGAKLADGVRFCEECGTEVPDITGTAPASYKDSFAYQESNGISTFSTFDSFKPSDWLHKWKDFSAEASDGELGIIVTREDTLLSQLDDGSHELIESVLDKYISSAARRGVKYFYCNLDNCSFHDGDGKVESVVASLRKIVDVARPKYLFILGNEDVIDVVRWENQARDGDAIVESDLCYSTLDVNTPWNGQKYNFDEIMRVGRLPSFNLKIAVEGNDVFARQLKLAG